MHGTQSLFVVLIHKEKRGRIQRKEKEDDGIE